MGKKEYSSGKMKVTNQKCIVMGGFATSKSLTVAARSVALLIVIAFYFMLFYSLNVCLLLMDLLPLECRRYFALPLTLPDDDC